MAMIRTESAAFREYASRLEITDWQRTLVMQRRASAEQALQADLFLDSQTSPQVIGSWDRHTMIAPLRDGDVDLLVPLDKRKHRTWLSAEGTRQALDRFREILEDAFPNTPKRRDRNCITLQFAQFRFDVVPAFPMTNLFTGRRSFKIPDSIRGRWVSTNPARFAEAITQTNKDLHGTFVPLIKMVKGWNRSAGDPLRSFHLETMLYRHFHGLPGMFEQLDAWFRNYRFSWMLRSFFVSLPDYVRRASYDPVAGDRLDEYLDNRAETTKREVAFEKARRASTLAKRAYSNRTRDDSLAMQAWRELMGEVFPAYG